MYLHNGLGRMAFLTAAFDQKNKFETQWLIDRIASGTLPRASGAGAAPAAVSFRPRRSALRLVVVDAHQAEAVRGVRTPIVVRSQPDTF